MNTHTLNQRHKLKFCSTHRYALTHTHTLHTRDTLCALCCVCLHIQDANGISISAIDTPEQFSRYLKTVSQNVRFVMPSSSNYFVEQAGDVKIFNGLQSFDQVSSCFFKCKILSTIHAQISTNVNL
jgi:hypothetical protein